MTGKTLQCAMCNVQCAMCNAIHLVLGTARMYAQLCRHCYSRRIRLVPACPWCTSQLCLDLSCSPAAGVVMLHAGGDVMIEMMSCVAGSTAVCAGRAAFLCIHRMACRLRHSAAQPLPPHSCKGIPWYNAAGCQCNRDPHEHGHAVSQAPRVQLHQHLSSCKGADITYPCARPCPRSTCWPPAFPLSSVYPDQATADCAPCEQAASPAELPLDMLGDLHLGQGPESVREQAPRGHLYSILQGLRR